MTTLIRVTDVEYRTDETETWLTVCGRAADGSRRTTDVKGISPYVFIDASESVDTSQDHVVDVERGYESYDNVPLKKVVLRHPKDTNGKCTECYTAEQRNDPEFDGIQSEFEGSLYEGDVPFVRRAGIDGGLSGYIMLPDSGTVHIDDVDTDIDPSEVGSIEPRVFMADIEAMPPDDMDDFDTFKEEAKGEITAITVYDTYEEEYVVFALDPEGTINAGAIRNHIRDHWSEFFREDAEGVLHNESESIDAVEYVDCDIVFHRCSTEEQLLDQFISLVEDRRPDLLSGWNWVDFDHAYILNRLDRFDDLSASRLSDVGHSYGYKTAQRIDGLPGFDMMSALCDKITFSEWRSQRLDYVADEELGIGKVTDVSVGKEYKQNRTRFLAYNIIDTQLLVALDEKHGIHEFFYQLSNLTSIQIYDAFYEMRLVDGFLMSQRGDDEILPMGNEHDIGSIPGGLVLNPADGVYEWVATFDLKSLYPSIFITLNVSEETITYDEEEADVICPGMPADEEAAGGTITEDDISWDIADEPGEGTSKGNAIGLSFDKEGIIPKYLRLLFDERASMKNLRDQYNPDEPEYTVYDNRQRAVKVVMNSYYGVASSPYYRLSTEDLGATITAGGRYTLWRGAQIAREKGYNVRYGDSIPQDEPILVRKDGEIDVIPIEEAEVGMEVWSEKGFTRVQDVIQKPNRKKVYRVTTDSGTVRVTEDHSLMTAGGEEVSPESVSVGDRLLTSDPVGIRQSSAMDWSSSPFSEYVDVDTDWAWLLGMFAGDGHAGSYEYDNRSSSASDWKIVNEDKDRLERAKSIIQDRGFECEVKDYRESSGCYSLKTVESGEKRDELVSAFRDMFYTNNEKRVPSLMFNSDTASIRAFLNGYTESDGYERPYSDGRRDWQSKDQHLSSGVYVLNRILGEDVTVSTASRSTEIYRVRQRQYSHPKTGRVSDEVKEIREVEYGGKHVYDLQTENGHFHAGTGSLIVHNTDSILIELADEEEDPTVEEVIETGKAVEKAIDEAMSEVRREFGIDDHPYIDMGELPHDLPDDVEHALSWEFETLYRRWMQAGSKKRYAGLPVWAEGKFYVDDVDNLEQELLDVDPSITGFESERADVPVVTERVQQTFLKMMLGGADFEQATDYIQSEVERVEQLDLPPHQVASPSVINKPLEEYPNMEVKRGCLYSNEHLNHDWREGDDPWLFPIESTPTMKPETDVLGLSWGEEPPEGFELDVNRVVKKKLREPLEPILSVLDYDFDELKTGRRVQSISVGEGGVDSFAVTDPDPAEKDPFDSDGNSDEPDEPAELDEPDDSPEDPFAESDGTTQSGESALDW